MLYARLKHQGRQGMFAVEKGLYYPVRDGEARLVDLPRALSAGEQLSKWTQWALTGPGMAAEQFLPAVPRGGKIICVGTNYKKHLEEMGLPQPKVPVLFSKFDNALAAQNDSIPYPKRGTKLDYEAELVLIIGKRGKDIPVEEALAHVFGITCGNDLSLRDLQFQTSQWLMGKTQDGFAPLGPYIRTMDGIDPDNLQITLRRNGAVCQQASTADMIFNCAQLIHHASTCMTLEPGDVIFTGTPQGVINGKPEGERDWLQPGDVLEVELEGVGVLKNTIGE